jgi:three-Cys-motif partner protein
VISYFFLIFFEEIFMKRRLSARDTNPDYWKDYKNLQKVKHELIEQYLSAWFPMLGTWSGRIVYVDTHAGRGRHVTGQYGSPLVAIKTLLGHKYRDLIFKKSEVVFTFIETDESNCESLESEIKDLGSLPEKIKAEVICSDCFDTLREIIHDLNKSSKKMAPAFVFVDPYGFKIPIDVLTDLMKFEGVELFVNVIWRELAMAIARDNNPSGMVETLSLIFGGDEWKKLKNLEFNDMADAAVTLLKNKIGARWSTYIRMLGPRGATRYILLHLSNHDAGRDLMKDCIWKVCPEGGHFARFTDNQGQQELITIEPDLRPLEKWVLTKLKKRPCKWQDLINDVRPEIWRTKHLNDVIRGLRQKRIINGRGAEKFFPSHNPELYLL